MSGSKKKSSKAPSRSASTPVVAKPTLPILPVPDFDPAAFTQLCAEVESLVKDNGKSLTTLQSICEEVRARGPLEALAQGERTAAAAELLQNLSAGLPRYLALNNELQAAIDSWQGGERRSRRSRFEQIAQACSWQIGGAWPEPVINRVVFIAIDEQKDRATINGRPVAGKPTAERLANAVAEDIASLQQNLTPPDTFIAQVWKAYSARSSNSPNGIQVNDLLAELTWQRQTKGFQRDPRADLFRGYSLAQFRADLTNYLAAGAPPFSDAGKSFELQVVGGSFAQDGIYMYFPQTDRLATCGRLIFQALAPGAAK